MVVRRIRADEGRRLREVRLAALADAPDAFASTYADEVARPLEWWDGLAARRCSGLAEGTFVAEADGALVGLAGGFVEDATDTVHLVSMWTAPQARRRGVARALVTSVVGWAQDAGAREVHLWVTVGNEPARLLYESTGFEVTGDVQPLPSNPSKLEVRMRRPLRH